MEPGKTIPQSAQTTSPNPTMSTGGYVPLSPRLPETLPDPPKNEGLKSILSTLSILIAAPIVAFLLTAFVFQSYEVDGPSMETTLQDRDRLLVLKLPRTLANLTNNDYVPSRGDIIVFNAKGLSERSADSGKRQLIKRVVSLPGDRVVVKNGTVTVFNTENPNGFNPDKTSDYNNAIVTTPGDTNVVIGEGQVFVLGDNRTNSHDSRALGPISTDDIVGKLIFRVYPLGSAQVF